MNEAIPKIVWCLWLQGWDEAPDVVGACLASWRRFNPSWRVHALDRRSLQAFLSSGDLTRFLATPKQPEALSDQIRIELLHRYGGVWADATTMCMRPLDDWLPSHLSSGFFAFERPGKDRLLATWFLAAIRGHQIIERWRESVSEYWSERTERDHYFWLHRLFEKNYASDDEFRSLWDATPAIPANHPGHFSPHDERLVKRPSEVCLGYLSNPPAPVFKLTHKLPVERGEGSFLDVLCRFGKGEWLSDLRPKLTKTREAPRKILVTWYGSFVGHGTIGDLRSLESVVTHLVGRGHNVFHATAGEIDIPGSQRADWREARPQRFDGVIFVCGPILNFHPQTSLLFTHFRGIRLIGVGVSLLPTEHKHHANPFDDVMARQGGPQRFADVAIVSPVTSGLRRNPQDRRFSPVVGLALRGPQADYGVEHCLWERTETVAAEVVGALANRGCRSIGIENHLATAGVTADEIEQQYAACDLIITSRFHGAMMALRHCVPFIAIDQIRGGAKVYDLIQGLGWRHVYKIEEVERETLIESAIELLERPNRIELRLARRRAICDANVTLSRLDACVALLARQ